MYPCFFQIVWIKLMEPIENVFIIIRKNFILYNCLGIYLSESKFTWFCHEDMFSSFVVLTDWFHCILCILWLVWACCYTRTPVQNYVLYPFWRSYKNHALVVLSTLSTSFFETVLKEINKTTKKEKKKAVHKCRFACQYWSIEKCCFLLSVNRLRSAVYELDHITNSSSFFSGLPVSQEISSEEARYWK